ncbi:MULTISPECIES: AI-2E family transporter [Clostridium]|uniref:AI-2E family transporter n=1 Tax=Clostridium TaxID=1485 RepID=UPI00069D9C40|nr:MULTISPECIES: AI-2E family transporter [Clostridium]KOF57350.1 membrane protein [Clostridium sp. DMHC 10]MCD2348589.1 AI-2E family transporter [Clostridium guangxiense]
MDFIREVIHREAFKKLMFFFVLILILYFARKMLNLVLLTFLFTYLINSAEVFIVSRLSKYVKIREGIVTIILYIIIITAIVIAFYKYIPVVINEGSSLEKQAENFYKNSNAFEQYTFIDKYISPIVSKIDIQKYTEPGAKFIINSITSFGKVGVNAFLALILSLFFIVEKREIIRFGKKFEDSKLSSMYKYFTYYGNNFLNSFGKVIKAQIIIAFVNTALSVVALAAMGFPSLMTLGLMIFILSLVPVAGVIISLVPLSLIAFKINGPIEVLYVLIMVFVIHSVETYFLNPKLMSSKTHIPIFFTFVILLVSEHFMGTWGLLLGIPLFMFILDVFNVNITEGVSSGIKKTLAFKKK